MTQTTLAIDDGPRARVCGNCRRGQHGDCQRGGGLLVWAKSDGSDPRYCPCDHRGGTRTLEEWARYYAERGPHRCSPTTCGNPEPR